VDRTDGVDGAAAAHALAPGSFRAGGLDCYRSGDRAVALSTRATARTM
jgi:hypothetical protein